jgi:hypothetical protein
MVKEREPCNIGMRRLYLENKLEKNFGYKYGAYKKSTLDVLMPNIAIYCYATVKLDVGIYKKFTL